MCNFSTEEAAIREVWMRKRCVSAEEERCLVVKEQTKWFFPLVPSSDFLPGLEEMHALCVHICYAHMELFVVVFFSSTGAL